MLRLEPSAIGEVVSRALDAGVVEVMQLGSAQHEAQRPEWQRHVGLAFASYASQVDSIPEIRAPKQQNAQDLGYARSGKGYRPGRRMT